MGSAAGDRWLLIGADATLCVDDARRRRPDPAGRGRAGDAMPPDPRSAGRDPSHTGSRRSSKRSGAIIGEIVVQPDDIFDTGLPGEGGWLYRTANKLHIRTTRR